MILITGANGFVGRELVQHLLREGWLVRVLLRRGSPQAFRPDEKLQVAFGDMRDQVSLMHALLDVTAVVHLAAAKSDEPDSAEINVGGARRLVAACHANQCRRVINVSTLSAKIPRKGVYALTKSQADEEFRKSALNVTTLLPSIIYGPSGQGVFGTIVHFLRKLPIVPVLGDGSWLSAPVHVSDVCEAISSCLRTERTIGRDYDIGGPDTLSFDELIARIAQGLGRHPRRLHIPLWLALGMARMLVWMPRAPITVSNVLGSNQNVAFDIGPARRDFGFAPRRLADGLREVFPLPAEPDAAALVRDARLISRYLLDLDPSAELIARYQRAWLQLHAAGELAPNARWLWVRRHPWALRFVDAAAAVLAKESPTRKQILLMAAILEATPQHAEFYLTAAASRWQALGVLIYQTFEGLVSLCVGIPIYFWAGRP